MYSLSDSTSHRPLTSALLNDRTHQLFASSDLEETRTFVGRVMKPHTLGVAGTGQKLNARMQHVPFGEVTLNRLKYGAWTDIVPDRLDDFFLVQMPIAGHAGIACGDEQIESTPSLASVLSPTEPIRMRWSPDNDQLMVRISRRRLERALAAQLGWEPDKPLRFSLGMVLRDAPAWCLLLSYLLECSEQGIDSTNQPILASQIEQLVVATLLCVQPHNFSHARPARRANVLPRHVRKVEEYLQSHAEEPICADQLALLAGVSLRSLYTGFKQFCGVSPMQYLKQLRLDRARAELLENPHISTVAGVALRWGFGHLGRFSVDYKTRFGESPCESLRRHR